jgi:hypothetical protein
MNGTTVNPMLPVTIAIRPKSAGQVSAIGSLFKKTPAVSVFDATPHHSVGEKLGAPAPFARFMGDYVGSRLLSVGAIEKVSDKDRNARSRDSNRGFQPFSHSFLPSVDVARQLFGNALSTPRLR